MRNGRAWTFRVEAETAGEEVVGVTGSCPELGNWKLSEKVVLLSKEPAEGDQGSNTWSVTTWIPACVNVQYRYYVCVFLDTDKYIIKRREVGIVPRQIAKNAGNHGSSDLFGEDAGTVKVDHGWLTSETVMQFKLYGGPVHFWKEKLRNKTPFVKLTTVNLARDTTADLENSLSVDTQDTGGDSEVWSITEVAALGDSATEFHTQSQFGTELRPQDFIMFQVQVTQPENTAFLFDLYMYSSRADRANDHPRHVGFSYVLPETMATSEGHLLVPITSPRHTPIGKISVYFLVVKPMPDYHCSMDVSYSKHWKHSALGLDVGHRGLGPSFKQKSWAELRENTIASLKEAASHGADFVEFDVQLSKDHVPIIYHDFHVAIALKRKNLDPAEDMLEIPLKELTLEQLQSLKVYHVLEARNHPLLVDEHLEEHQPFPTLQHALEVLDQSVGFNIEIKWTMMLKDGTFELNNPLDINKYLDSVLKVVMEHGGPRKIVFSCFHPDICTILKYKQPKYPVVFLTQGVTSKYPMYHDPRCHTVEAAVHFARVCGILGINVHTEDILRDASLVRYAKERGMVIFCWGDDNNDPDTIKYLKQLGLHAVIYDKINEFGPKRQADRMYTPQRQHREQLMHLVDNIHTSDTSSDADGGDSKHISPAQATPPQPSTFRLFEATPS